MLLRIPSWGTSVKESGGKAALPAPSDGNGIGVSIGGRGSVGDVEYGVMIAGVVEHHDHAATACGNRPSSDLLT
jgi:hypothetical protein